MRGRSPPKSFEDLLEDRHQEGDQSQERDPRKGHDQRRVDHRGLDLTSQRVVLFELVGYTQQRLLEDAARLPCGHHGHVEVVEDVRMLAERLRQRQAGLHVLADHGPGPCELVVVGLLLDHIEGAQHRHARGHHRGQLAGGHGELGGLDLAKASEEVDVAGRRELLDVQDDQAAAPQLRGDRLLVLGVDLALAGRAREVDGLEGEGGHAYATRTVPIRRRSSSGAEERDSASSRVINCLRTRSARAVSIVCMPWLTPVCRAE